VGHTKRYHNFHYYRNVLFYPPSSNLWEHGGCPSAPLTHKVCKTYPQSLGVCLTDFSRPKQYTSLNKLLTVKHTSLLHELSTNNYSKNYVKLSPVSSWTFIKFQRSNISTLVRLHCLNILYKKTLAYPLSLLYANICWETG
jgi:hypothetical protein